MPKLLLERPGEPPTAIALGRRPLSIGRSTKNDICIPNPYVSRRHARIEPRDGGYDVVDTGSTNGTALNGHEMGHRHHLAPGDEVWLGGVSLVFQDDRMDRPGAIKQH